MTIFRSSSGIYALLFCLSVGVKDRVGDGVGVRARCRVVVVGVVTVFVSLGGVGDGVRDEQKSDFVLT